MSGRVIAGSARPGSRLGTDRAGVLTTSGTGRIGNAGAPVLTAGETVGVGGGGSVGAGFEPGSTAGGDGVTRITGVERSADDRTDDVRTVSRATFEETLAAGTN